MSGKRASKSAAAEASKPPVADNPEASPSEKTIEAPKAAKPASGRWVSFEDAPPPKKERFAYCRQMEGGSKVAAFAEISESADGPGLWVDGVSGIQPLPTGDGHWWQLIELPD